MFRTFKHCELSCDENTPEKYRRWSHASIEFYRPILLSTFKYREDDVDQIGTHMCVSLEQIEHQINREDLPVQKLQILTPDGDGWVLLDIATIRRSSFFQRESKDSDDLIEKSFEEFITSCGECFTFETLAKGDLLDSPHEVIYQVSTKCTSV